MDFFSKCKWHTASSKNVYVFNFSLLIFSCLLGKLPCIFLEAIFSPGSPETPPFCFIMLTSYFETNKEVCYCNISLQAFATNVFFAVVASDTAADAVAKKMTESAKMD